MKEYQVIRFKNSMTGEPIGDFQTKEEALACIPQEFKLLYPVISWDFLRSVHYELLELGSDSSIYTRIYVKKE